MHRGRSAVRDIVLPVAARVSRRPSTAGSRRVLILQPDHLGDILLSQPAVAMLREWLPDDELVGVVGPWSHEIAERAWPVDRVITIDFPGFTRAGRRTLTSPYAELRRASSHLVTLNARAAVILRPDAWWATWLASLVAPVVVAADDSRCKPFATYPVSLPQSAHATERAWMLAAAFAAHVGASHVDLPSVRYTRLHFPVAESASARARELLQQHHVSDQYVVIHPGSGAPVKAWPNHRWGQIARYLTRCGLQVVVTGSETERATADEIVSFAPGTVTVAGRTEVSELAELLRCAKLAIGPDCGPLHLAVAVDTPTLHLFGPSDPVRYGPWGDTKRHRVLRAGWSCARCGDLSLARGAGCGCMLALQWDTVAEALDDLLAARYAP